MYIKYYELRNLVFNLACLYKEKDIKKFVASLEGFNNIESIINFVKVKKEKDKYEVSFMDKNIGVFKSDFDYTVDTVEGKIRILKYLLYRNFEDIVPEFLKNLLDINCEIMKNGNDEFSVNSKIINVDFNKRKKFNNEIDIVECKMEFYVYGPECLIGLYKYNGDCYINNKCKTLDDIRNSIERDTVIEDKKFVLKNLLNNNYWYFKNNIQKNLENQDIKEK